MINVSFALSLLFFPPLLFPISGWAWLESWKCLAGADEQLVVETQNKTKTKKTTAWKRNPDVWNDDVWCYKTKLYKAGWGKRANFNAWHTLLWFYWIKFLIPMFLHGASWLCTGMNNEFIFTINLQYETFIHFFFFLLCLHALMRVVIGWVMPLCELFGLNIEALFVH